MTNRMHGGRLLWLAWGAALRRWHRYDVRGIEHLDGPGPRLILGYHGRFMAFDLIILNHELWRRKGQLPVSIMHRYTGKNPALRWLNEGLESATGDGPEMRAAVDGGRDIVLLPGGNREANRSHSQQYRLDWGERMGWLRLALRYRLPIVPVAAAGVDHTYIGLNDGYRLGKRFGTKDDLPLWLGLGPLGLAPFSPTFPVKFRQVIGAPIDLGPVPADAEKSTLEPLRLRVLGAMQQCLDSALQWAREEGSPLVPDREGERRSV